MTWRLRINDRDSSRAAGGCRHGIVHREKNERWAYKLFMKSRTRTRVKGSLAGNRKWNESLARWREVIQEIAKEGFLKRDGVPRRFVERLTEPQTA